MNSSVPKQASLVILSLYIFLLSCSKSNNCPDAQSVTINLNETVVVGWPLRLEAEVQSTGYIYKWSGPNGWAKHYDMGTSDAYLQVRENMTAADAGEYKLQLINTDGCVEYEGITIVNVTSTPPCNTTANTCTSSSAGLGNINFAIRTFVAGNDHFVIRGRETDPGDYVAFVFPFEILPEPGIYETTEQIVTEAGTVGLVMGAGGSDYMAKSGQPVFVTRVNGKIEVAFCSVQFLANLNPTNSLIISAKIIEP